MGSRIAYLLLILVAFSVNYPRVGNSRPVSFARASVRMAAYPLQWSVRALTAQTYKSFRFFIQANKFEKECRVLSNELNRAEAEIKLLNNVRTENQYLREALGFKGRNPYGFYLMPAEVVSRGGGEASLIVNRGSDNGVKEGQTVISRYGLVGRIGEVSRYSSKVVLLGDSLTVVSAVLSRTNTYGVVHGGSPLTMNYVSESASVEVGDKVVVSSASSTFKRNLAVGTVRSVSRRVEDLFQKIELKPAVDFSKLEILYICQP
jgi:rod shape-determining protein MreC